MQATNFPQLSTVMLLLLHPTSAVCGLIVDTIKPSHELGVELGDLFFDFQAGFLGTIEPAACNLIDMLGVQGGVFPQEASDIADACLGGIVTKTLNETLEESTLAGLSLIKDLPACPTVDIEESGNVIIDFKLFFLIAS